MNRVDLRICDDYLQFQNVLKESRKLDDLIINTLNTTVLTSTFRAQGSDAGKQCQQLASEIGTRVHYRNDLISSCLTRTNDLMNQSDLTDTRRKALIFQRRQIQNERNIEEIVQTNTEKAFYERCRDFYSPTAKTSGFSSFPLAK